MHICWIQYLLYFKTALQWVDDDKFRRPDKLTRFKVMTTTYGIFKTKNK